MLPAGKTQWHIVASYVFFLKTNDLWRYV